MTKKFSKLLLAFMLIILTLSLFSVSFAEVDGEKTKAVTTSETEGEAVTTSEEKPNATATEEEIHNGDLYIFDTNIVMDKLVDGNVFLFGSKVEVTGQVNGNLFVFADEVSFNESYIRYTIFACANSVYYNGACNDLYVATNDLDMTYDSYVVRDLKALSSDVMFRAAIGRDVDLISNIIDFGEGEDIPVIYGNLRYSATKEYELPEGVITDKNAVTYTKPSSLTTNTFSIVDILIGFATCIVTTLVIYVLSKKVTPKFSEKLSVTKLSVLKLLKSFVLGLASLVAVLLISILLLLTTIGAKLAFILILIYAALCLIAVPTLVIIIANMLKPAFKIEKNSMFCLILALISVILHGITLIPFVGTALGLVIKLIGIGLLINIYLPHKELTEEEKTALEEAKLLAKENKEKAKQEKLEAKEAKKQAKLEAKEAKKENKKL